MQYRIDKKTGNKLSVLGLGCMRFPRTLGAIDMKKADEIIMTAIEKGINYFDTAWMYSGSEEALGEVLEKNHVRDKVYIASKLPIVFVKKTADFDRYFDEELKRLRTGRIDYYLMHMLTDLASWEHLLNLGIGDWIDRNKKAGRIGQIGFSFHGSGNEFLKILDAYPWEFCQIQYNYSDENFQAGVRGLKKAAQTMPVIIMEPLLGGKLANGLPRKARDIFRGFGAEAAAGDSGNRSLSPAGWALRWLWNQKETAVVLSGMSDTAQVIENADLAGKTPAASLSEAELDVYQQVKEVFNESYKIHCTGCGYCMPCPKDVNIPACFAGYNTFYSIGRIAGWQQYITSSAFTSRTPRGPGNCVACGRCEDHCPQKLPIIANLKQVRRHMEPFWLRIGIVVMRAFLGVGKRAEAHSDAGA
jgi:predicted aldo/keto reductase-like oxidoreductase